MRLILIALIFIMATTIALAAAVDPLGDEKYWWLGLPYQGVKKGSLDAGEMKYWDFGLPTQILFPSSVVPPGGGVRRLTLLGAGS